MQYYTGVNTVKATAMSLRDYHLYRDIPPASTNEPGYLVEVLNDPYRNHKNHQHRILWMPAPYFETHYQNHQSLDFGQALFLLNQGARLTRALWKDVGVFVEKQEANQFISEPCLFLHVNGEVTPWFGTNRDYFASDWMVIQD